MKHWVTKHLKILPPVRLGIDVLEDRDVTTSLINPTPNVEIYNYVKFTIHNVVLREARLNLRAHLNVKINRAYSPFPYLVTVDRPH